MDWILKAKRQLERLKGGKADFMPDKCFDPKSLKEGAEEEAEHTSDKTAAKEIAKDHLVSDKKYYKKLKTIEKAQDWLVKAGALPKGVIRSKSPGSVAGIHDDVRIGRTSSGKSIFSNPKNTAHEDFTPADHREAYVAHAKVISRLSNPDAIAQHKTALNHHFKMMTGGGLAKAKKRPEHADWSKDDHGKAMHSHHRKLAKYITQLQKHTKSRSKSPVHEAAKKALRKLVQKHAAEVHYHHTHHLGE